MRIKNPGSPFHDEPMKIVRTNRFSEGFAQAVQKIEDQSFFDLNLFFRTLETADPDQLRPGGNDPCPEQDDEEPEKQKWPHVQAATLLRRRLLLKVLF